MVANDAATTTEPEEIARFEAMAEAWWDTEGKFKPLHRLNPPRLALLRERLLAHFGRDDEELAPFQGLSLLDIGCGGGLLAEPLARQGFSVTGIDAGAKNIGVASLHARNAGLSIDYRVATPESIEGEFDVVMAMEVLEHVPDIAAFLTAASSHLKPGGVFVAATVNRTVQSFALAIVGAEYILGWLPRGTHRWKKFVRPSELAMEMRHAGITPAAFSGIRYEIGRDRWVTTRSLEVNYLAFGVKEHRP